MKFAIIPISVFAFLILASAVLADTITMNTLQNFWWNDSVTIMGNATYTNGSSISSATVNITSSKFGCSNTTENDGEYFCTFRAPLELGKYSVTVNITNSSGAGTSNLNYTNLVVRPKYGENVIGTTGRIVYETPFAIQEPSGRIRVVFVRLTAWRR